MSAAHPWNKDILSQAADEDEIAAAKRKVSKDKKYSSELDMWVIPPTASSWSLNILANEGGKANQFLH